LRHDNKTVVSANKRLGIVLGVVLMLLLVPLSPAVVADGEEEALETEAERLTYEILELKSRLKVAENEREALLADLAVLDTSIASTQVEMASLREELEECQQAYNEAVRSLYIRGEITELEVLLGARELEELWEDNAFLDRIAQSEVATLDRLKSKLSEVGMKERDLRDQRLKRERLAQTLDSEALEGRIAELEADLSEINGRLRGLQTDGGGQGQAFPDPPAWSVPPPGKLLDRVPSMPPLSDFERTGMVYSGYTTSYGAEFHGRSTASGVIYNMYDFTCAHRTLPFGTWLLVTFQGRQTIVQVNDRGPFVPGRVLDLSFGAAQSIGLDGVQWTEFEILIPKGG
jgi:hypothetical protein